jgi:translocation and assembly module TamB
LGLGAVGGLLLLVLLLWSPPGLALVGRLVRPLSGGAVTVEGLSGFFPDRLRARAVTVSDAKSPWLRIENVSLDWSALAALRNHITVADVTAARAVLLRRPVPAATSGGTTPRIDVGHFSVARIDIAAPVIGHPVSLAAHGALHYVSRHQLQADLAISRLGNSDAYRVLGGIAEDVAQGDVTVREGSDGILAKLLGLPGLGPVNLAARAGGTRTANALSLTLSAGSLHAGGHGVIALASRRIDLDFTAAAPAMKPRPDMGWRSLSAEGHLHGSFDAPQVRARLALEEPTVGGLTARAVSADLRGDDGSVDLAGAVSGVAVPGLHPDLFARAPVEFAAHADLKAPSRPVRFTFSHPLVRLSGEAQTRGGQKLTALLTVPSLAPFAALQGIDFGGRATARLSLAQAGQQFQLTLNGRAQAHGASVPARILGPSASLDAEALVEGSDIVRSSVHFKGAALETDVRGDFRKGVLNYRLALDLTDLSRLAGMVRGSLALRGNLNGALGHAALSASGGAVLATKGFARQRIDIVFRAAGLPAPRSADLTMNGHFDNAPFALNAEWRGGKARQIALRAHWRSLQAKADIAAPQGAAVSGNANLQLQRLADIALFTGARLSGAANAAVSLQARGGKTNALLKASLKSVQLGALGMHDATLHGSAADLFGKPLLSFAFSGHGIASQGASANVDGRVAGPPGGLVLSLDSHISDSSGAPARLTASALLDAPGHHLSLTALDGDLRGVTAHLAVPMRIDFARGLALDRLVLRLTGGEITAGGQLLPGLVFHAEAKNIALSAFRTFLPQAKLEGLLSAHATLTGTLAAPRGTIALEGRDLRSAGAGRNQPAASAEAQAVLHDGGASVTAALSAGKGVHLDLKGELPLIPQKSIALRVGGSADLALLDPFLAAEGQRVRGMLTLDGEIGGTWTALRIDGSGKLSGGEIQDYARGLRIHDIGAALRIDHSRLTVSEFTGHAGPGTLSASGTVDFATTGMPLDFTINAKNARPVVSDLLTATLSGDAKVSGTLAAPVLSGEVRIQRAEINLPENFPPDVAILHVRRRGQPPLPRPSQSRIAFDVRVGTAGPVLVRGHGVDATMGGEIRLGGSSLAPAISGGLRMERGSYNFAGQTLEFTSGRIGFDGTGVRGRLDPTLDFVAQTVSGGVTATLTVGGYASAPKITLSSAPQLPQDEIVAHLLFQQSVKQLTPLQMASIAQGIGSLGGIGGGFDPLGALRRSVGLDRLAVGSTTAGASGSQSETTIEAGRYVARNVYVGVKQDISGGTHTQVQFDITRHLKAQATVSAGTNATVTKGSSLEDNGSSVGLSYQFEY